jgi:hypothetical protein
MTMLRGPLHNRGADGLCEGCGEPFPCPDGLAIYEAVKRELNVDRRVEPQDESELLEAVGISKAAAALPL